MIVFRHVENVVATGIALLSCHAHLLLFVFEHSHVFLCIMCAISDAVSVVFAVDCHDFRPFTSIIRRIALFAASQAYISFVRVCLILSACASRTAHFICLILKKSVVWTT